MRKFFTMIAALMMIASVSTFVGGCKKKEPTPGETIGNAVDSATKDASKAADDAKKAVDDATKDMAE